MDCSSTDYRTNATKRNNPIRVFSFDLVRDARNFSLLYFELQCKEKYYVTHFIVLEIKAERKFDQDKEELL